MASNPPVPDEQPEEFPVDDEPVPPMIEPGNLGDASSDTPTKTQA